MGLIGLLLSFYINGAVEVANSGYSKNGPVKFQSEVKIEGNTVDLFQSGEEIYLAECKKCHGVDGKIGRL